MSDRMIGWPVRHLCQIAAVRARTPCRIRSATPVMVRIRRPVPLGIDHLGCVGCAGEVPDDLSDFRWLVQGDEGVAVFYLDQLSLLEEVGEAPAVRWWHHAVVACPDHEGGTVE